MSLLLANRQPAYNGNPRPVDRATGPHNCLPSYRSQWSGLQRLFVLQGSGPNVQVWEPTATTLATLPSGHQWQNGAPHGISLRNTGTTIATSALNFTSYSRANDWTFASRWQFQATGAYRGLCLGVSGTSSGMGLLGNNETEYWVYDTATSFHIFTLPFTLTTKKWYTTVCWRSGTTGYLFIDGQSAGTVTGLSSTVVVSSLYNFPSGVGNYYLDGHISIAAIADRVWDVGERDAWFKNPFGLITRDAEPSSPRAWKVPAAGGGTVPPLAMYYKRMRSTA